MVRTVTHCPHSHSALMTHVEGRSDWSYKWNKFDSGINRALIGCQGHPSIQIRLRRRTAKCGSGCGRGLSVAQHQGSSFTRHLCCVEPRKGDSHRHDLLGSSFLLLVMRDVSPGTEPNRDPLNRPELCCCFLHTRVTLSCRLQTLEQRVKHHCGCRM